MQVDEFVARCRDPDTQFCAYWINYPNLEVDIYLPYESGGWPIESLTMYADEASLAVRGYTIVTFWRVIPKHRRD